MRSRVDGILIAVDPYNSTGSLLKNVQFDDTVPVLTQIREWLYCDVFHYRIVSIDGTLFALWFDYYHVNSGKDFNFELDNFPIYGNAVLTKIDTNSNLVSCSASDIRKVRRFFENLLTF